MLPKRIGASVQFTCDKIPEIASLTPKYITYATQSAYEVADKTGMPSLHQDPIPHKKKNMEYDEAITFSWSWVLENVFLRSPNGNT